MNKLLKEKLETEFKELLEKFPLKKMRVDLIIRDAKKYGSEVNESFICDKLEENDFGATIFIFYNAENVIGKTDKEMIKLHKIKREFLPFWYLYHEYGHLIELDNLILESGVDEAKLWLKDISDTIAKIKDYSDKHIEYKEINSEKNADLFANNLYMNKVKELILFYKKR